ncbi:MAG: creatininase family protein [Alphaproteobacteria bacterium]|nr:creatininase family protein [Alphaproteobacteria bacterium]
MLLSQATWPEVGTYLESKTAIIIPIGSTEQHGPSGLLGTDAMTAEAVARGVGEAEEVYVAPTISVGMAQHHMAFPGTITLMPSTLVAVIRDYVTALSTHGFTRFFFINGHGGNIATINTAFQEIYAQQRATRRVADAESPRDVRCRQLSWFLTSPVQALTKKLYGNREGRHATPSEIAVTQHLFPDQIRDVALPEISANCPSFHDADDFRRHYPDGRMGADPSLAKPAHGDELLQTAVRACAQSLREFLTEA